MSEQPDSLGSGLVRTLAAFQHGRERSPTFVASSDSDESEDSNAPVQNMPLLSGGGTSQGGTSDSDDGKRACEGSSKAGESQRGVSHPLFTSVPSAAAASAPSPALTSSLQAADSVVGSQFRSTESSGCTALPSGSTSTLPSADDFDRLGDERFLFVAPPLQVDPTWRMTPKQQEQAAADKARGARTAVRDTVGSLPMNKYGRGLNVMQLDLELSARAIGVSRLDRSAGVSVDDVDDRTHAGAVGRGFHGASKKRRDERRGGEQQQRQPSPAPRQRKAHKFNESYEV